MSRGKEISEDQISIGKSKIVIKKDAEKGTSSSLNRTLDAPVNIIEYDGAGLQLGIGGRGLNPKRTAHPRKSTKSRYLTEPPHLCTETSTL